EQVDVGFEPKLADGAFNPGSLGAFADQDELGVRAMWQHVLQRSQRRAVVLQIVQTRNLYDQQGIVGNAQLAAHLAACVAIGGDVRQAHAVVNHFNSLGG